MCGRKLAPTLTKPSRLISQESIYTQLSGECKTIGAHHIIWLESASRKIWRVDYSWRGMEQRTESNIWLCIKLTFELEVQENISSQKWVDFIKKLILKTNKAISHFTQSWYWSNVENTRTAPIEKWFQNLKNFREHVYNNLQYFQRNPIKCWVHKETNN